MKATEEFAEALRLYNGTTNQAEIDFVEVKASEAVVENYNLFVRAMEKWSDMGTNPEDEQARTEAFKGATFFLGSAVKLLKYTPPEFMEPFQAKLKSEWGWLTERLGSGGGQQ